MAIRYDITIDWSVSPRIIEIAAPSDKITVQDLYDTLRYLGADFIAINEDEIVDASGKEVLSAILLIGLTVKLINAKVKFENRTSPPCVLCDIFGGNLVAVDEYDNPMNPVEPSENIMVTKTASSSGTLMNIVSINEQLEEISNKASSFIYPPKVG